MCILTYAVNLFLLIIAWLARSRFERRRFITDIKDDVISFYKSDFIKTSILVLFVALICMRLFLPKYWELSPPLYSGNIKQGVTELGDPWIGAEKPILTITEYTDYMCFQCMKMHYYLRKVVEANPDKVRLVHINYPMDKEFNPIVVADDFHIGSGKLALLSEYASERDDFWRINDRLFEIARLKGNIDYKKISEQTGLSTIEISLSLNHDFYKKMLAFDIKRGMKKRIMATPSYVINDKLYTGTIPSEFLVGVGIK